MAPNDLRQPPGDKRRTWSASSLGRLHGMLGEPEHYQLNIQTYPVRRLLAFGMLLIGT